MCAYILVRVAIRIGTEAKAKTDKEIHSLNRHLTLWLCARFRLFFTVNKKQPRSRNVHLRLHRYASYETNWMFLFESPQPWRTPELLVTTRQHVQNKWS